MPPKTVLVTGANGYIGNAVARSFVAAGWLTYGLIRSPASALALAAEEIQPIIGSIDDLPSHKEILAQLPPHVDTIVSTTEDMPNYVQHFENIVSLCKTLVAAVTTPPTASASDDVRTKPLVIFTSGCKDYGAGVTHFSDHPDLRPHTEDDPIQPPAFAVDRANNAVRILDYAGADDGFPAVVVRPTNVFGRSSSFYRVLFEAGKAAVATEAQVLRIGTGAGVGGASPTSICHAMHVDDCGDAYVAIAEHRFKDAAAIDGQAFNISARAYETVDQVAQALVAEYGLKGGVAYVDPADLETSEERLLLMVLGFPQWTGSEKLRRVTGWTDRRPLFTEATHVYWLAFEAAERNESEVVKKSMQRTKAIGEWLLSTFRKS